MELKELIVGAQEAMDGGDFRLALTANTHALKAYPACFAAHRMIGEAYLERGERDPAVKHFERTLQIDPLNVVARLGLGVAAEESKDHQAAYAHYLHAWEINPALDQVRDELVRLRGLLNVDDRLHPTRAGLAGIHARAGQFRRAIGEWRAVLTVEPESRRGRTALAELLWRNGDDAGAASAAREALVGSPENARALAILADVERRRNAAGAEEVAQRFAQVDPTGAVIDLLQPWRSDVDLSFLQVDFAPLDDFDFTANRSGDTGPLGTRKTVTASLTSSHLAAPDLWDTLVKDLETDIPSTNIAPTLAAGVEPFNWSENGAPKDISPESAPAVPLTDLADQLFGNAHDVPEPDEDPEELVSDEATADQAAEIDVVAEAEVAPGVVATAEDQADMNPDKFDDLIRAMAAEEPQEDGLVVAGVAMGMVASVQDASISPVSTPPHGTTESHPLAHQVSGPGDERSLPTFGKSVDSTLHGRKGPNGEPHVKSADFVDPFVTADGQIDLTRGWDDLDRALADATPGVAGEENFDALLADLDGIKPFDADVGDVDEDAWAPLFGDDLAAEPAASSPSANAAGLVDLESELAAGAADFDDGADQAEPLALPAEDEIQPPASIESYPSVIEAAVETKEPKDAAGELLDFADLEAFDVSPFLAESDGLAIEPEIVTGIPGAQPSGYTELLRNVDEESLVVVPAPNAEVDPFAIPDGAGAPLDVDELLEVTSSDGTGPLASAEEADETELAGAGPAYPLDFAATEPDAALAPETAADFEFELDGIVPFDSGAFAGDGSGDESTGFGEIDVEPVAEPVTNADLDVEPFAPEIRPFGYTEALSALDEEPFDFSDVVVEMVAEIAAPGSEGGDPESELELAPAVTDLAAAEVASESAESPQTGVGHSQIESDQPGWAGKDGLGMVAHKVLWPKFVNQTSELIDRALEMDGLFERIATQKQAMVAQGAIGHRLTIGAQPVREAGDPEKGALINTAPRARNAGLAAPEMSEQTRLDLMAMRIRLIEDEDAAPEIAAALELALAEGLSAPLALRVLGEAYLKMGLVERAAAQFRQAMLARRRAGQEGR